MARAETKTPERLEAYAKEVEDRCNAALAELGLGARMSGEARAIIDRIVPDDWEWRDASYIGGHCRIVITLYSRL